MNFFLYLKTIYKIGIINCFYVLFYRVLLRIKFYKFFNKIVSCPVPENLNKELSFFYKFDFLNNEDLKTECLKNAEKIVNGNFIYYGKSENFVGKLPNWFFDYKNKVHFSDAKYHWSECRDTSKSGDIKECWELSRWNWAPTLSRAFILSGNKKYIDFLNKLIQDWCKNNPYNSGINWLCGQEISIRLINALISWKLLESDLDRKYPKLLSKRVEFVALHLRRISKTLYYAKAQNNNHWITESAALFIGGNWLLKTKNIFNDEAKKWSQIGRSELEKSIRKLVMNDGSFPQQSLTYHRFVLDTLSQVEIWRRHLNLSPMSNLYSTKFSLLIKWLYFFVDKLSGDAPNLGGNDGSFCFQLHDLSSRDFRPTLQLSCVLEDSFKNSLYEYGRWNEPLIWFDLEKKSFKDLPLLRSKVFPDGGYINFRTKTSSWALLRLPKYSFRPSQNDPFHFDLWHKGKNILRDGGSYSYNCPNRLLRYFSGIESHNTIEFKGDDQMIPFRRFLMGSRITFPNIIEHNIQNNFETFKTYYYFKKNFHERKILNKAENNSWEIFDTFYSSNGEIIVRWRLIPIKWKKLKNLVFESSYAKISLISENKIISCRLVEGFESRFYSEKKKIPVIELIISGYEGKVKTIINTL